MKREHSQILRRVLDIQAELDIRKALYTELDLLTLQLQSDGFVSAELDGLLIELIDNFKTDNTCYRVAGVKHYELKVKKPKAAL